MKDYLFVLLLFCFNIGYTQSEEAFTLVLLPDTQTYTEKYPEIFEVQTEWIAEQADQFTFVLHQGDVTQTINHENDTGGS